MPGGTQIVEAMLKDAEIAVRALAEPSKRTETLKMLRLDRTLLEHYAVRGKAMMAYAARKAALGVK